MTTGFVLPNLLAITPRGSAGTIPTLSDDFEANQLNTRSSNTVYVSSLEIAARIVSPLPQPTYDDAPATTTVSTPNLQALTTCRVHFVIIQDMRPSETDSYGQAQPVVPELNNQVGTANEPLFLGALESQFKTNGLPAAVGALSTLEYYGFDNALKSFKKGLRYRIHAVHSYNLNLLKAYKDVKFRVKLNRKVAYQQQRVQSPGIAVQPVKNSFHVIPICNWNANQEAMEGNNTQFIPTLTNLRSRCWFRDSS